MDPASRVEIPLTRRPRREVGGAADEPAAASTEMVTVSQGPGSRAFTVPAALLEPERVEHACGIYGVHSTRENASRVIFFALYALNHRGQESAGIASYGATGVHVHKGMGLVSQVFDEADIATLSGPLAIGHTRYSTLGGSKLTGAQPFVLETDLGQLAIVRRGAARGARRAPSPRLPTPHDALLSLLPHRRRTMGRSRARARSEKSCSAAAWASFPTPTRR